MDFGSNFKSKVAQFWAQNDKNYQNFHFIIPTVLRSSNKSICFNILRCRLPHCLALELYFDLLMNFLSFSSSEAPTFCDKSSQMGKKILFLAPASTVSKTFWGSYRSKILPESVRASKNLQFGYQFFPYLSIQSRDISKNVKIVKFDPQV